MRQAATVAAAFVLVFVLTACATPTPSPEPGPTPTPTSAPSGTPPPTPPTAAEDPPGVVTLGIGQEAESGGVKLRFVDVVSDSRCPAAAHCVRAGEAVVDVAVTTPAASEVVRLGTPSPLTETSAVVGGYRVELVDVTPTPVSTRPIAESDYRLRLRVTAP